jgi:hypothetical protein
MVDRFGGKEMTKKEKSISLKDLDFVIYNKRTKTEGRISGEEFGALLVKTMFEVIEIAKK